MTSSEDVILQVNHVKYKKDVGTLYMMHERICWIQANRDIVTVSHHYANIKSQKISSDFKPKVQLQILLHDNNATFTFQFVDPGGQQNQFEARNQVKELLRDLLIKFQRPMNTELEKKNRLLKDNPALLQLYKDLVAEGIISAEEFWEVHAEEYISKNKPNIIRQDIGISSGFLSGIHPHTDGTNGLTYNLTPEIMESIFKTYPAVRKKHIECVPAQMTESEFWIKFFQSHYFHRDRLPTIQDLFSDCAKADDKEMRRALERLRQKNTEVMHLIEDPGQEDCNKELLNSLGDKQDNNTSLGIHHNMIKRFNQHSIMLMNAYERTSNTGTDNGIIQEKKTSKKGSTTPAPNDIPATPTNGLDNSEHPVAIKKPKLTPETFEDLSKETTEELPKLALTKIDRYMNGPIPYHKTDQVKSDDILQAIKAMREFGTTRWGGRPHLMDSKTAVNLLGELNPGGSMMKASFSDNTSLSLSPDIEAELRNAYVALSELLRHFWSCFPPTTATLQAKLVKTYDTIKKFEQIKLQKLKDYLQRDHLDPQIVLAHIYSIIEAAERKYNARNGVKR